MKKIIILALLGSQKIVIDPIINKREFDEKRDIQFINKNAVEGIQIVHKAFNLATN